MKNYRRVIDIEWEDLKSAWKIWAFPGGFIKHLDIQGDYKCYHRRREKCGFR